MRQPEPELAISATPKYMTHRNYEIISVALCLATKFGAIRYNSYNFYQKKKKKKIL